MTDIPPASVDITLRDEKDVEDATPPPVPNHPILKKDELPKDKVLGICGLSQNEQTLCLAFVTFMLFSIAQVVAAFIADSESMLGDSWAMIVDSFTYLFNFIAERRKRTFKHRVRDDPNPARSYRKLELQMEIIAPSISIAALIAVLLSTLVGACQTLVEERRGNIESEPNTTIMMVFASINLGLDILNVGCFQRSRFAKFCFCVGLNPDTIESSSGPKELTLDNGLPQELDSGLALDSVSSTNYRAKRVCFGNLNMCSAFTHVFADTLRSVAVLVAAAVAAGVEGVVAETADAAAAVSVSFIIFLTVFPLLFGLYDACYEYRQIAVEERSERT